MPALFLSLSSIRLFPRLTRHSIVLASNVVVLMNYPRYGQPRFDAIEDLSKFKPIVRAAVESLETVKTMNSDGDGGGVVGGECCTERRSNGEEQRELGENS